MVKATGIGTLLQGDVPFSNVAIAGGSTFVTGAIGAVARRLRR